MKTKSLVYSLATLTLVCTLALTSCRKTKKENEEPATTQDTDQSASNDNNVAEQSLSDIQNMAGEGVENGSLTTYKGTPNISICTSSCATITFGTRTFTIDFGPSTTTCVCNDGKTRSGKLMFDYTASPAGAYYRTPGFSVVVTSSNYVVDGYTVNINNHTTTNTTPAGFNPTTTNLTWSVSANVSINKPGGGTITWTGSRTKELTNTSNSAVYNPAGTTPIDWTKAIIKLNGSASGMTAGSESFTSQLINLTRDMNCTPNPLTQPHRHPFVSGQIKFTPGTKLTRTLDFGSGTCDLSGTITIGTWSSTFTMP